jgi:hypothetical protein
MLMLVLHKDALFHWDFAGPFFLVGFTGQGVLNKDHIIWLNGAMLPPCQFLGPALA